MKQYKGRCRTRITADELEKSLRRAIQSKVCPTCQISFAKKDDTHQYNWRMQKFCSKKCAGSGPRHRGSRKLAQKSRAQWLSMSELDRSLDEAIIRARS